MTTQETLKALHAWKTKLARKLHMSDFALILIYDQGPEGRVYLKTSPAGRELGFWTVRVRPDGLVEAGSWFETTGFMTLAQEV